MPGSAANPHTIEALRRRLREIERCRSGRTRDRRASIVVATGIDGLDDLLPGGGVRDGTLVEWLAAGGGAGAGTLALKVAARFLERSRALVVIDERQRFYPAAATRLGIDLDGTIVVHPRSRKEALWALEQSLRCAGVGAVACWINHVNPVSFRRLQLATEVGGGLGLLLRPVQVQRQPSWADLRLLVQPIPTLSLPAESLGRRLRVTVLSCRGGGRGGDVVLDIDDEGSVRKVPSVVSPADSERAAGA